MFETWFGSMGGSPLFWFEVSLVAAMIVTVVWLIHGRCRTLISKWAAHGGWEIVGCRRCVIDSGPFPLVPGMPIYRVELKSRSGRQREAYVRCGNFTLSVLADEVAVEWIESESPNRRAA